jgi:hypothetical protein
MGFENVAPPMCTVRLQAPTKLAPVTTMVPAAAAFGAVLVHGPFLEAWYATPLTVGTAQIDDVCEPAESDAALHSCAGAAEPRPIAAMAQITPRTRTPITRHKLIRMPTLEPFGVRRHEVPDVLPGVLRQERCRGTESNCRHQVFQVGINRLSASQAKRGRSRHVGEDDAHGSPRFRAIRCRVERCTASGAETGIFRVLPPARWSARHARGLSGVSSRASARASASPRSMRLTPCVAARRRRQE